MCATTMTILSDNACVICNTRRQHLFPGAVEILLRWKLISLHFISYCQWGQTKPKFDVYFWKYRYLLCFTQSGELHCLKTLRKSRKCYFLVARVGVRAYSHQARQLPQLGFSRLSDRSLYGEKHKKFVKNRPQWGYSRENSILNRHDFHN